MLRLSVSKLKTFEECPRKFKFNYLDKLGRLYHKDRPYLTMGENVHAVLKEIFTLPSEYRNQHMLENMLLQKWEANRKGFKDKHEEEFYKEQALNQLRWFTQNFDLKAKPFMIEARVQRKFGEVLLEGVIDRVDKEKGKAHLIDYKTGQIPSSLDPFPLYFYTLVMGESLSISKLSYVYLKEGEIISWDWSLEDFYQAYLKIIELAYKISRAKEFPANIGEHCKNCDFKEICFRPGKP